MHVHSTVQAQAQAHVRQRDQATHLLLDDFLLLGENDAKVISGQSCELLLLETLNLLA
jgi:hypothetical protein